MSTSEHIDDFLTFMRYVPSTYHAEEEILKHENELTQDYLHKLELGGLKCKERSKLATKLMQNRQRRREAKDTLSTLRPIYEWLQNATNEKAIRSLEKILGEVRKEEKHQKNRYYVPRIEEEDEI